jgi:hypothetical protein
VPAMIGITLRITVPSLLNLLNQVFHLLERLPYACTCLSPTLVLSRSPLWEIKRGLRQVGLVGEAEPKCRGG